MTYRVKGQQGQWTSDLYLKCHYLLGFVKNALGRR
jgi:hypothetical protein